MTGHTLSQPLYAQDQDPEPLALSWPAWEPRSRQQAVSAPASRTSWAKASCCAPYRPMPKAAPSTLAACVLLEPRLTRSQKKKLTLRLKTPMGPSSKRWTARKRRLVTPSDSRGDGGDPGRNLFLLMSDPGHSSAVHATLTVRNRFNAVRHSQTNPQAELQYPEKARTPEQDPNPNQWSHQGHKGERTQKQNPWEQRTTTSACVPTHRKSTASPHCPKSAWRPLTPAGFHQLGQRRCTTARSVATPYSRSRTEKLQSEIQCRGSNKEELYRPLESTSMP